MNPKSIFVVELAKSGSIWYRNGFILQGKGLINTKKTTLVIGFTTST